jgi:lipopolysaccharide transport system permease protein
LRWIAISCLFQVEKDRMTVPDNQEFDTVPNVAHPHETPTRLVIDADQSWVAFKLRELWQYRELLIFLTWQQVIVRYKQTVIGIVWIVLQPLLFTAVLTLIFSVFLGIDTGDIPYPAFLLAALIHWRYFSDAISRSSTSLVGNSHLVSKIYFPRLIIPISGVATPLVDFALAFGALLLLLPVFGVPYSWNLVFVPLLIVYAFLTALAVSLWLSALNVRYRDVNHLIPFLLQVWMYLTPVVYPIARVPEDFLPIFILNPMVGVVQGARWAILGLDMPDTQAIAVGFVGVVLLLLGGIIFFNRMERSFADVV